MIKKILCISVATGLLCGFHAQVQGQYSWRKTTSVQPYIPSPWEAAMNKLEDRRKYFQPSDPWRYLDGETVSVRSQGFVQFVGRVIEVHGKGIRVEGYYGAPCIWPGNVSPGSYPDRTDAGRIPIPQGFEFFVKDYPYRIYDGQFICWEDCRMAKIGGDYKYSTVGGTIRTLRMLEYGTITSAPPPIPLTPEQIAAKNKKNEEAQAAVLRHHQKLAAQGDAYGLFCMGERYLKGNGVETNIIKGRAFLMRAAVEGNTEAKALLENQNVESLEKK